VAGAFKFLQCICVLSFAHILWTGVASRKVYADDVNLLGDNIDTTKKNTQTLIDASKDVGLDVNTDKTKYMLLSRHQKAGQNHDIKRANRCFENVAQFRYLGTTITNQNLIQEEIKRRLKSGNACYHSVQNLFFSRVLSNMNTQNYIFVRGSVWV
jgi:ribosomal protein S2